VWKSGQGRIFTHAGKNAKDLDQEKQLHKAFNAKTQRTQRE
jgi:hypothetical protein